MLFSRWLIRGKVSPPHPTNFLLYFKESMQNKAKESFKNQLTFLSPNGMSHVLESQFCDEFYNFINESPYLDFVVTCDDVIKAISRLKNKMSCWVDKVSTQYIVNRSYVLVRHISLVMEMIFDTGIIPSLLCIGDLTPIHEKGKSESQCSSITVSTTHCKLSELLFIDTLRLKCYVPPYQFDF